MITPNDRSKSDRGPKGENYVWMTSMGLSVGIVMIVGLLLLIVYRGSDIFWPERVALIEVDPSVDSSGIILGEIRLKGQQKATTANGEVVEWQLFRGNRDAFGETFIYVPKQAIQKVSYPEDVMVIDRMEYGPAVGYALSIKLAGNEVITSDDPGFISRLRSEVDETTSRWKRINKLEKLSIGAINQRINSLALKKKSIADRGLPDDGALARLDDTEQGLQREYEVLAEEARVLRQQQDGASFTYRLANGQEKTIQLGQMVEFYFPNRLGFFGRVGFFVDHILKFLTRDPREANTEGGVWPALFGTFIMTIMMSMLVTPFGVLAAIYLREYARQGALLRTVRIAINNLAGVPSIVFGVFGLGFFVYFLGGSIDNLLFANRLPSPTFGTGGIMWASFTLALLTLPVVIVASEEALSSVSQGMREASLACGASKWQTISRVVLPAAAPGVLTGMILAMARGAGEVAPLMLVGVVKLAPTLPINSIYPFVHLDQKFMHLGFHIYDLGFQSPDSEMAIPMVFATTMLLIALVFVMNLGAILIREKLRKKYAAKGF